MSNTDDTIKIRKLKSGSFSITKDKNLLHMLGMANSIQNVVFELSMRDGKVLENSDNFTGLLNRIVLSDKSIVSSDEVSMLREWIDCLCLFHLEADGIKYKEDEMSKFLRIAQNFLKKTKQKDDNKRNNKRSRIRA